MRPLNYRPTAAYINLKALKHNFFAIKKNISKNVKVLAAVKADGYGHGLIPVSKALEKYGVDYLGTGTVDEAVLIKKNRIKTPVLNLTAITNNEIAALIKYNIIQTVPDIELAKAINTKAEKNKKRIPVHLKIDTGMGRLGAWHEEAIGFIKECLKLKNIITEGIFTHFASADINHKYTHCQIDNFTALLNELESMEIKFKNVHAANSAAVVLHKDSHFNIIRPGIMVYGMYPSKNLINKIELKPVLSLKTKVTNIRAVPAGRYISYNNTYKTKRNTRIAVMPIGYGDGYNRLLSNRGYAIIGNSKFPIAGRVCMDQTMLDVGNNRKIKPGQEIVLIGEKQKNKISVEEIADLCYTIPYEITCCINKRVPRIYI